MARPRILAFAGSLRRDSFNSKLVRIAARGAENAGADVTVIDLRDFPMPIYDQDIEDETGMPEKAQSLKDLFLQHDGLLISAPEYNSSITAALKNTIDWVSRRAEGEPRLAAYQGKVAALMSASPGALGGLRGLVHVRAILSNIGVLVLPTQVAVGQAHEALTDAGDLKDEKQRANIEKLGVEVARTIGKLKE